MDPRSLLQNWREGTWRVDLSTGGYRRLHGERGRRDVAEGTAMDTQSGLSPTAFPSFAWGALLDP
jgi:hypothetical protein